MAYYGSMDYYTYGDLVIGVGDGEMADVSVYGFEKCGLLTPETLRNLSALSGRRDGTVMAGLATPDAPLCVAVCHKGKLYDVSDCGSGSVKVFKLKRYRIGLLVDLDALDAEYWLRLIGWCDFAVCIVGNIDSTVGDRIAAISHSVGLKTLATDGSNTVSTL